MPTHNAKERTSGQAERPGQDRRAKTRAAIIEGAFDLFGSARGLQSTVEDIAKAASVTRATFYNHFTGMADLREAVFAEKTASFLDLVRHAINRSDDPRIRVANGIRYYLQRGREDRGWAWSMLSISAGGVLFGIEGSRQAEQTVSEGMEAGLFRLRNSAVGRDLVLGASIAAMSTIANFPTPDDYPELIAGHTLTGLGVSFDEAKRIAMIPLPPLTGRPSE